MTWGSFPAALLATLAVEVPLAAALARRAPDPPPWLDALLLNCLTHPLATLAVAHGVAGFWPVEAAVAAVEAAGYRVVTRLPWRRAGLVSLACNGATAALSLLLRA